MWSACFAVGKSQGWMNLKEDMKYDRKLTLCLATKGDFWFLFVASKKKRPTGKVQANTLLNNNNPK